MSRGLVTLSGKPAADEFSTRVFLAKSPSSVLVVYIPGAETGLGLEAVALELAARGTDGLLIETLFSKGTDGLRSEPWSAYYDGIRRDLIRHAQGRRVIFVTQSFGAIPAVRLTRDAALKAAQITVARQLWVNPAFMLTHPAVRCVSVVSAAWVRRFRRSLPPNAVRAFASFLQHASRVQFFGGVPFHYYMRLAKKLDRPDETKIVSEHIVCSEWPPQIFGEMVRDVLTAMGMLLDFPSDVFALWSSRDALVKRLDLSGFLGSRLVSERGIDCGHIVANVRPSEIIDEVQRLVQLG